jgi:NAD(P)-dependent dehydrogenase (short-subunit alcohol dehydrogenase family)
MTAVDSALPLAEQVAVVTGASRGIGLAIAQRLAHDGARVAITGRNEESLEEVAAEFPEGRVLTVAGKVDDPDHRAAVLDRVAEEWGRLDILVNNAGINPVYGRMVDADDALARKMFDVNVLSPLAWVRSAVGHAGLDFERDGSRIVNVSSVTGFIPSPGIGLYSVTKAALMHLTKTLAVEMGPAVRVNGVAPAVIRTRFAKAMYEGREDEVAAGYPLARLGEPDDVAGAVAYLVSTDSSWVTGHILTVDGGLMAAGGVA